MVRGISFVHRIPNLASDAQILSPASSPHHDRAQLPPAPEAGHPRSVYREGAELSLLWEGRDKVPGIFIEDSTHSEIDYSEKPPELRPDQLSTH